MTEKEQAIKLANRVLDTPNRDPDDDLSMMSRHFLRALERNTPDPRDTILAKMAEALKAFADAWGLGVAADRRMWEAARTALAEYEAWSGAKGENEGG